MKIYTKIILDKNNNLISEEFYDYNGPLAVAGIHYSYKNTRSAKLMEKQAKKEKKLAEKKAKREAKEGSKVQEETKKTLDTSKPITLDFLTNPDKQTMKDKEKNQRLSLALKKNLKKRKIFQKKNKKKSK